MTQHTPGPWKIDSDDTPWTEGDAELAVEYGEPFGTTNILFSVSGALPGEEEVVARLLWEPGADDGRRAELMANARLIAAAPELLEALRDIYRLPVTPRGDPSILGAVIHGIAERAIAKVEGGK